MTFEALIIGAFIAGVLLIVTFGSAALVARRDAKKTEKALLLERDMSQSVSIGNHR